MTLIYYRTVEELDKLPDQAVILDDFNTAWQKGHLGHFSGWLRPGSDVVHQSADINLPARLLDDGL